MVEAITRIATAAVILVALDRHIRADTTGMRTQAITTGDINKLVEKAALVFVLVAALTGCGDKPAGVLPSTSSPNGEQEKPSITFNDLGAGDYPNVITLKQSIVWETTKEGTSAKMTVPSDASYEVKG